MKSIHKCIVFSCDQCAYKATQKDNLLQHIKSILQIVMFSCNECDYKQHKNGNLLTHMTTHAGVKFSCNFKHIKSIHESVKLFVINVITRELGREGY